MLKSVPRQSTLPLQRLKCEMQRSLQIQVNPGQVDLVDFAVTLKSELVISLIQSTKSATRVYTPGSPRRAQPSPCDTIPAKYDSCELVLLLHTNGPPESPSIQNRN